MTKQAKGNTKFLPKGLEILHEDRDILVVNKPSGLLTIATESEKAKTALCLSHRLCKERKF